MFKLEDFKLIWNSDAILTPAEKAKRAILVKFGVYCKAIARNSMIDVTARGDAKRQKRLDKKMGKAGFQLGQRGEKVSLPGNAAFSRLGFLKGGIYSAADKDEVVIGPAKLSGVKSDRAVEVLEHGGIEQLFIGKKRKVSVSANFKARPTMALAFAKAIEKKLPDLIAGGIMREV